MEQIFWTELTWSKGNVYEVNSLWDLAGAKSGPCYGHSYLGLRDMSFGCLVYGTMLRPCLDHFRAMFCSSTSRLDRAPKI